MYFKRESKPYGTEQFTVGKLISELEKMSTFDNSGKFEKTIVFDFGSAIPTVINSWRGSYEEMALGYVLTGYDSNSKHFNDIKITEFIKMLKESIGKTFEGWKGGDWLCKESTPLWVANNGNNDHSIIVGLYDEGFQIVLLTGYTDY